MTAWSRARRSSRGDETVGTPATAPIDRSAEHADRLSPIVDVVKQVVWMSSAALLYFAVRGRTQGEASVALRHGHRLLGMEGALGIDVEHGLQELLARRHTLVTLVNWIYIFGHWPVIVGTLIWLFRTRRFEYLVLRNALFVSGAIGLVIFMAYPVAPPRLLGVGLQDTVTQFSTAYRTLQPPALINKYAAMPSLHVGWNLLVGVAVVRASTGRWFRCLGIASPLLMTLAVLATANHYLLDAVVGSAVALAGLAASLWVTPRYAAVDVSVGGSTERSSRIRTQSLVATIRATANRAGPDPQARAKPDVTQVRR